MRIVIQDQVSGKRFMIQGHGLDWEIFKESKGKFVDGKLKGEGEWTSCRNYPTELQYAIAKVINWLWADTDDPDPEVTIEAKNIIKDVRRIVNNRAKKIVAEVIDND